MCIDREDLKQMIEGFLGSPGRRPKLSCFIIDHECNLNPVDLGRGIVIQLEDKCGIFISGEATVSRDTVLMISLPDEGEKVVRFVTKSCCSNVIEIGLEVSDRE